MSAVIKSSNCKFVTLNVKSQTGCPVLECLTQEGEHMDLKKLFSNNKAVSPVIGVVLMVAITVILAAAIGSSVFGQGPAKSAPQANINAMLINNNQNVTIEHLGGDTIVWSNSQIRFSYENGSTTGLNTLEPSTTQFAVGQIETFQATETEGESLPSGEVFTLKITDNTTNQLICDKKLRT